MKDSGIKNLTLAAMIAALYVVLTILSHAIGLASSQIQIRLSEALAVLPFLTPAAIPGLFVGCILANIFTGALLPDIIFGSLATLAGAVGTYALSRLAKKTQRDNLVRTLTLLAPLPAILANTLAVPFILRYVYGIVPIWLSFITVFAGEFVSAGVLGHFFLKALCHSTKGSSSV